MTSDDFLAYGSARTVLLDALEALEVHRDSLVLVGAQGVYVHTGEVAGTGAATTTDGDLALDADLLGGDPELAETLRTAGFVPGHNPGSWMSPNGVAVDLMVVPHQSGTVSARARAARLPPHDRSSARVTPGLEAALVDHSPCAIVGLLPGDERTVGIKVAGPAALLVAKCVKIEERAEHVAAKPHRLKTKDAVDVFRLLFAVETARLVEGCVRHAAHDEARRVSGQALRFLATQRSRGQEDVLAALIRRQLSPVQVRSYQVLADDLLDACVDAGLEGLWRH